MSNSPQQAAYSIVGALNLDEQYRAYATSDALRYRLHCETDDETYYIALDSSETDAHLKPLLRQILHRIHNNVH